MTTISLPTSTPTTTPASIEEDFPTLPPGFSFAHSGPLPGHPSAEDYPDFPTIPDSIQNLP